MHYCLKSYRKQKVQLQVIHSCSNNISFIIAHVFTFLEILINISPNGIELLSCTLSFHFSGLPSISFRSGLAVTNSLSFYLSGNVLISLSFWKGNFAVKLGGFLLQHFIYFTILFFLAWFLKRN